LEDLQELNAKKEAAEKMLSSKLKESGARRRVHKKPVGEFIDGAEKVSFHYICFIISCESIS
jgi:hypothetical protein